MLVKSLFAFLIGGLFCVIAQILLDKTAITPARILVGYVVFGVLLGALGVFEPLFKLSGCGVSLPLVGFGANVAKGVKESVDKLGFFGVLGGAFEAASVGCTVSLVTGFVASLFFKGKTKKL